MSGYSGIRAARSGSGDACRYRVGALVAEHRETEKAMWAAIDAHGEAQRTHVARLEKLVGAIDYELSRGGQTDHIRAVACRRLVEEYKASGLSTRGGEGAWCSPGGGWPVPGMSGHGPASIAGGAR